MYRKVHSLNLGLGCMEKYVKMPNFLELMKH